MFKMINKYGNVRVPVHNDREAAYYETLGYKRVEESNQGDTEGVKIDKMSKAQLEAFAETNGIDLTGCSNNKEKAAKIKEALSANE